MKRLLPVIFSLLLAVCLPARGQAVDVKPVERPDPLNLSLPQDAASPDAKSARIGEEASRADPRPVEEVKAAARNQGGSCQRSARDACGAFPYGTGFEARNRGAAGGRGMGRGR